MRKLLIVALVFLSSLTHVSYAQTASPTRKELPGEQTASPWLSSATFAIGMSRDGNKSFVDTVANTDNINISALVRPEPGHLGQAASLYLVVMVAPGQYIMRNQQGRFEPWNGNLAALTPYLTTSALGSQNTMDIFSGVLGEVGEFRIFVGYAAADGVLHYTAAPLTIKLIADHDNDGLADNDDTDDDNDKVADGDDLFPLNAARTMAIVPQFPKVNGIFQFPDYPSTRQIKWLMSQLAATTTSIDDINAHFSPTALSHTSAIQVQSQLQSIREASPNPLVIDPVTVTPTFFRALIGTPNKPGTGRYLDITVKYASGFIDSFRADPYPLNASITTLENRTLTLAQSVEKLANITPNGSSVLVARIQNNQCVPIVQHNAAVQRSTGSIFKEWVLGALGQAINDGVISSTAHVPLVAAEIVTGTPLSSEPLGTSFPLVDMATLMIGISENSATDHLHALVGRVRLEAILAQFNHSRTELMTPFLSVNEQFNLFSRISAADALAYRDGTEQYQRDYLNNVLVPFGRAAGNRLNSFMLINGAWQASAMDVCAAMAAMRQFNDQSPGFKIIDQALSSEAVLPFVRNTWERVWFKGGGLGSAAAQNVLTYSWLLESDNKGTYVVVSMHNDLNLNFRDMKIDMVLARILELIGRGDF